MFNKGKIEELNNEINRLNALVEGLSQFGALGLLEIQGEISKIEQQKVEASLALNNLEKEIAETKASLIETQEIAMLQEVGVYQYTSVLDTASGYSEKIAEIRSSIKERNIANGGAIRAAQGWTVNGSTAEGSKMVKEFSKLMLRAYNGEVDDAIRTLKPFKLQAAVDRVNKVEQSIEKLGKTMQIEIDDSYHKLRVEEIRLTADFLAKKEEEKELQKEERLRLKEEEKAQKEFEREKEKLNKELQHHQAVLSKADETGNLELQEEAKAKIAEVESSISGVEERVANIRTGYVYVISNIGSFGERVLKIGLTRRIDPEERIQELSDASVPFKFDVHAIIFSVDAVSLEKQLHQELNEYRLNKVNPRKEFFSTSPAFVKELLTKLSTESILTYKEEAEAPEWRISSKGPNS
jgi:Domain of unknown function (DUF4041)/T5orf172 domain